MSIPHFPKDGPQPPRPVLDAKTLTDRFPAVIETAQRLGLHLYNVDTSATVSNRSGGYDVLCSATFHERGIEFFCEASSGSLSIRATADNQESDLGHAVAAEVLPAIATVFADLLGVPHDAPAHDCENALEELARIDLAPHLAAADKRARDTSAECLRLHGELSAARKRIVELEARLKGTEQARDHAEKARAEFTARMGKAIGLTDADEDSIISHAVRIMGYTDELERREAALRMACARLVGWECPLSETGVRRMVDLLDGMRGSLVNLAGIDEEKLGRESVLRALMTAWADKDTAAEERVTRMGEEMARLLKSNRELELVVAG